MIRTHWAIAVALLLGVGAANGQEPEAAGQIKTSRGSVSIERAGARLPVSVGASVFPADKVRTGEDGAVGITLRDNTLLSAGPNSLLRLDRFAFDQTTHAGSMLATVAKGTLSVVTGKIARQSPQAVEFRTPTSILGVRGTEFVIEVVGGAEE